MPVKPKAHSTTSGEQINNGELMWHGSAVFVLVNIYEFRLVSSWSKAGKQVLRKLNLLSGQKFELPALFITFQNFPKLQSLNAQGARLRTRQRQSSGTSLKISH
jgi:hypothetical protein